MSNWSASRAGSACLVAAIFISSTASVSAQLARAPEPATPVHAVSATAPVGESVQTADGQTATSQAFVLPAEHHPWARFSAGAWREVRTTTETFDAEGRVASRSVTTQQESLHSATDERYALDVQATVDLVGKRITGKWINRILQTATDGAGAIVSSRRLPDAPVELAGQTVTCQVWELTYNDDARALVDRVWYHADQFPYVLRRETHADGGDAASPLANQVQEVIATETPYLVEGELLRCTCLKTTRQGEKGSSERLALVSSAVPGGEVAVWTTDFDPEGRRTRWSSQELLDYGVRTPVDAQSSRRESRRVRRQNR